MFLFHINLTLTVAMVTEMAANIRLDIGPQFRSLMDDVSRNYISAQLSAKAIFYVPCFRYQPSVSTLSNMNISATSRLIAINF